jgi:hypothetical protein
VFDVCRERGREREGGEREQERPGALGRERGRESERHTQTAGRGHHAYASEHVQNR